VVNLDMPQGSALIDFFENFSTDQSCLEAVAKIRQMLGKTCPKCRRQTRFSKMKKRNAYACQYCGHQIYPLAGTIFTKSTTPLRLWFYALYRFSQSPQGVSIRQLQKELEVTYKTAWRILHLLRGLQPVSGLKGNKDSFQFLLKRAVSPAELG